MRAVVLFNKEDIIDYDYNHREINDIIIPISPLVRHYADAKGWEIRAFKDLWGNKEFIDAKVNSENSINLLIKELNLYSRPLSKNFPIEIGSYFDFFLRNVIGQIHYSWFILNAINKTIQPDSWFIYKPNEKGLFMSFYPDEENVLFDLFVNSSFHKNLDKVVIKERNKTHLTIKEYLKKIIPNILLNQIISIKLIKKFGYNCSIGKIKLLNIGPAYDWAPLFSDDRFKKIFYVKYINGETLKSNKSANNQLIEIFNKSVVHNNIVIYNLEKQARIIHSMISYFDNNTKHFQKKLKKYSAILNTIFIYPEQNFIADLAGKLNKPVICWQHGEMGCSNDPFAFGAEARYTTHYLCYAPLILPKYEKFIGEGALKQVYSVGNCMKHIKRKQNRYILYSTGKWMKNGIPFIDAQDPDSRLYEAQKSILEFLNSVGNEYEVIFKTSNNLGSNELVFKYPNIKVENSLSFTSLVENASIVILDSPATTCIETVSTNVPLFILSGRTKWYELPMALLKKRAVVSDNPDDLVVNVKEYLTRGTYLADTENNEFYKGYGSENTIEITKQKVYNILVDLTLN